jgi:ABC-type sugar transport system permease subunit
VTVLYFMYEEGFKWWNLGSASAVAFILFLCIFAVTMVQLWVARNAGGRRHVKLRAILLNVAVALIGLIVLFPLAWMVSVSFMSTGEAATFPPPLLPKVWTLEHYRDLFVNQGMGRYMWNSSGAGDAGDPAGARRSPCRPATPSPSCGSGGGTASSRC